MVRWTRHGRKQWWQTHSPTPQLCSNQKRGSLVCSKGSSSSWSRDRRFSRRIQYCGFHQAPQWRHWNAESKRYKLCLPFLKGSSWFTEKDINYIYIYIVLDMVCSEWRNVQWKQYIIDKILFCAKTSIQITKICLIFFFFTINKVLPRDGNLIHLDLCQSNQFHPRSCWLLSVWQTEEKWLFYLYTINRCWHRGVFCLC